MNKKYKILYHVMINLSTETICPWIQFKLLHMSLQVFYICVFYIILLICKCKVICVACNFLVNPVTHFFEKLWVQWYREIEKFYCPLKKSETIKKLLRQMWSVLPTRLLQKPCWRALLYSCFATWNLKLYRQLKEKFCT